MNRKLRGSIILILATINRIISPSHPPANTAVSVSLVFCVIRNDISKGQKIIHPMMINLLEKLGLVISPEAPVSGLLAVFTVLAVSCFALVAVAKRIPFVKKLL